MPIPVSFLAALALLVLHDWLDLTLPGAASLERVMPYLVLLAFPWFLAWGVGRRLRRQVRRGGVPTVPLRLALAVQSAAVPAVYSVLVFAGDLPGLAYEWAPNSSLLQLLVLLGPLLLMEISLRLGQRRALAWVGAFGLPGAPAIDRLVVTLFVSVPLFLFGAAVDATTLHPSLHAFLVRTAPGNLLGFLLMVVLLCMLLPVIFRCILPVTSRLPERAADSVRRTAEALGFPRRAVLMMHTGHRMVNAALIGPLPWPRYLVLTDGLVAILDTTSLSGVVGHEVGHARAGHPALLLLVFVGLPALLYHPARQLPFDRLDWTVAAALLGCGGALVWFLLRALAHRFELEADQMSAMALGGALPCITALQRVGELSPRSIHKASFRHPSEAARIESLLRWERDPGYRARFARRARAFRVVLAAATVAALALCVASLLRTWPLERAGWLFHAGNLQAAATALTHIDEKQLPDSQRPSLKLLAEEVAAARELAANDAAPWREVRDRLALTAWQRGCELVARGDVPAARPFLALALLAPEPSALQRSLAWYADAVVRNEDDRARRLRDHMLLLGVPKDVGEALTR